MPSPDAANYLNRALDIVQQYSLYRDKIDWASFRSETLVDGNAAMTIEDTYSVLERAMVRLGEHNAFLTPAKVEANDRQVELNPPKPSGQLLAGPLGYVQIPSFPGALSFQTTRFAQQTQDLIRQFDGSDPAGWIIDLRKNMGGNRWPMFAGLGPLLGEGVLGAFVFPSGEQRTWYYRGGTAGIDGDPVLPPPRTRPDVYSAHVTTPYQLSVRSAPVAVLTGPDTRSAGEAVAVAFRGRSRTFGESTAGLNTAVGITELSDGALILLAMAFNADRAGQKFTSRIPPDEEVMDNNAVDLADDAVVKAASSWLLRAAE